MPNNILIIDNGSIYLSKLKHICGDTSVEVKQPGEIELESINQYDLIILSGGSQYEVMVSEQYYKKEMEMIKKASVPIIGICLGFQLIAHTFNVPVLKLNHKEFGVHMIHMTKLGQKLLGEGPFEVFDDHYWVVTKIPADFHSLATSESGLEAIIHNSLPIAGFQFHPEMFVSQNDGITIFKSILTIFQNRDTK